MHKYKLEDNGSYFTTRKTGIEPNQDISTEMSSNQ